MPGPECIVDTARAALKASISDLAGLPARGRSGLIKGTIQAVCETMRPHIVRLAPTISEARESLTFIDELASSPVRNVKVIIAFAERLVSLHEDGGNVAEPAKLPTTPNRTRGRPGIPDELKRKALSARTGKARAQILYRTNSPTSRQIKDGWKVLDNFVRTHPDEQFPKKS